jgi:hypothetical protein
LVDGVEWLGSTLDLGNDRLLWSRFQRMDECGEDDWVDERHVATDRKQDLVLRLGRSGVEAGERSALVRVPVDGPAHVSGQLQAFAARPVPNDDDVRGYPMKRFDDPDQHRPAADRFEGLVPPEPAGCAAGEDHDGDAALWRAGHPPR